MPNNCIILSKRYNAFLVLPNGKRFYGYSVGHEGMSSGELCFTTAMTGYQHVITDPSYAKQIVIFSTSHVGNVGINEFDDESSGFDILASGIIIPNMLVVTNHSQSNIKMTDWLKKKNIVAISNIDTRELIQYVRDSGSQNVMLFCGKEFIDDSDNTHNIINEFFLKAGQDQCEDLSAIASHFDEKFFKCRNNVIIDPKVIILIDFGVKEGIIRCLQEYFDVYVRNGSKSGWSKSISMFSGVVLSNGPGDPQMTYEKMKEDFSFLFLSDIPILGICLGHQIVGIHFGGETKKMFLGHRSITHPVYNIEKEKILISSQNHGFVVDIDDANNDIEVTYRSLIDGSIEGMRIKDKYIYTVQFHPEASAGTNDALFIFREFFDVVTNQ